MRCKGSQTHRHEEASISVRQNQFQLTSFSDVQDVLRDYGIVLKNTVLVNETFRESILFWVKDKPKFRWMILGKDFFFQRTGKYL